MGIADEVRAQRTGVRISAQKTFTNRVAERAAFDNKVLELRAFRRANPDWATDLSSPRRNVLVFYGHGGIGKTSLSTELERELEQHHGSATSVRVDFANPASRDPEVLLLSVRAGLAHAVRSLPAFDTALSYYWQRRHPGTSVVEFVKSQPAIGGATDREALAKDLKEFVLDTLDGGGLLIGGARRAAGIALTALRHRSEVRRLERDCPFFTACIEEQDIDQLRLHLPLLLAWDLSQAEASKPIEIVVFLDTFEHVTGQRRAARLGGLEDTAARCAFFLSAVTFVVTSRTRLDWSDDGGHQPLEFSGVGVWPRLVVGSEDADQHHVGALDLDDCLAHLEMCLLDGEGEPAIPSAIRHRIADLSGGVPLYLDVAVSHYVEIRATGREALPEDFARGVPQIVLRLMDDLSEVETDLFRCASLLGVFDQDTLRAACPDARASSVNRFLDRTLVTRRSEGIYSLHEVLLESVRTEDHSTADPWSDDDWQQAERRILDYWAGRFADGVDLLWEDRRLQTLAFWQLASLYATTDVVAEVVAEITMQVQLRGAWSTIGAARAQPSDLLTPRGHAFMDVLDGLMARQVGHLAKADELLTGAIASGALGRSVARLAAYYLGETRDVHVGSADEIFLGLEKGSDRVSVEASMAYAHSLIRRGDLQGALDRSSTVRAREGDPEFAYRQHELQGTIWLFAGEFQRSTEHFERSRLVAQDHESMLLEALSLRHVALALCWLEPGAALVVLDRAERLNRDLALPPGVGQCLAARAVASCRDATRRELAEVLAESEQAFEDAGYLDDAVAALGAAVFVARARNEDDRANQAYDTLIERSIGRRPRTWLAAADVWMDRSTHLTSVSWPLGLQRAVEAWSEPLHRRRNG